MRLRSTPAYRNGGFVSALSPRLRFAGGKQSGPVAVMKLRAAGSAWAAHRRGHVVTVLRPSLRGGRGKRRDSHGRFA